MEFLEVIKNRRSTRSFCNNQVEKDKLLKLIESARLAPSAANRQPWYFVVLEGENKNKIAEIMRMYLKKERKIKNSEIKPTKKYKPTSSIIGSIRVINEAPVLIMVLRDNSKEWFEADYLSIGAAIQNICLTATNLGISSLWIRDVIYVRTKLIKALKLENMDLVSAIALGYSNEHSYERKKKELNEIMKWI